MALSRALRGFLPVYSQAINRLHKNSVLLLVYMYNYCATVIKVIKHPLYDAVGLSTVTCMYMYVGAITVHVCICVVCVPMVR